jgi:hypothetical protein
VAKRTPKNDNSSDDDRLPGESPGHRAARIRRGQLSGDEVDNYVEKLTDALRKMRSIKTTLASMKIKSVQVDGATKFDRGITLIYEFLKLTNRSISDLQFTYDKSGE